MRVDFNGIMREMTEEEIKEFEQADVSTGTNEKDSNIADRVNKLEEQSKNNTTEITSLREALNIVQEFLNSLSKTTDK